MDLLSDVLRDLSLESAVLSTAELRAPWGLQKDTVLGGAPFHVVIEGRCLIEVAGAAPMELNPGDLVVFPHGDSHALLSDPRAHRTPFKEVMEANGIRRGWSPGRRIEQIDRIEFGEGGATSRIIMGVFAFRDQRRNRLIGALPPLIHVRGRLGRGPTWLENSLNLLIDAVTSAKPGFQTVAERAADIVFVETVRDFIANGPVSGNSWLRGLMDPQIARALSLVHGRAGDPWTVASLAKAVALSRTGFAQRFSRLVGMSVMEYVTDLRMHRAAGMLTESKRALVEIANDVSYQSEISFSKAFRRWSGLPPGQYRRRAVASADVAQH